MSLLKPPPIIGVTGYAQHGKDTIANYLVAYYGYTRLAFADSLKDLAERVNPYVSSISGWRLAEYVKRYGWERAKTLPEVRRVLQELGTGARDMLGNDVWIRALHRELVALRDHRQPRGVDVKVVIPDVRFPNEAHYVEDDGGAVWRVHRVGYSNTVGTEHISESSVDRIKPHFHLYAETVDELHELVRTEMMKYANDV